MRRSVFLAIVSVFCILVPLSPSTTLAHDLIPPEAVEYLRTHPTATSAELAWFLTASSSQIKTQATQTIERVVKVRETTNFLDNASRFIYLGVEHILSGADHILFILSLLLVFRSWKDILKMTGTFTVAHSITLVLAGTGLLMLSSRIVEPIIAFSIAYVALTSVYATKLPFHELRYKLPSIFLFGLFHGLGFAGLLEEIHVPTERFLSSLIFFNVGIEIGQLTIILCILPFILLTHGRAWYPKLIRVVGLVLGTTGILWGVQRIFV